MLPKKKFVKPLETEKEIAKSARSNPKAFYRYVNSKTKSQVRIADLIQDDGTEVTDNKEKAQSRTV